MTAGRNSISNVKNWNTPPEYVEIIKSFFGGQIELDPCSNETSLVNAKIEYILPKGDGLLDSWDYRSIYVNPPYGRNKEGKTSIKNWLQRCADAHRLYNSEIIALVPVATNTKHWQNNIFLTATSICFLRVPRLKFWLNGVPEDKGSPMSCCLVYWGSEIDKFKTTFSALGKVILI